MWLDKVPLSRGKKCIEKDFADAGIFVCYSSYGRGFEVFFAGCTSIIRDTLGKRTSAQLEPTQPQLLPLNRAKTDQIRHYTPLNGYPVGNRTSFI